MKPSFWGWPGSGHLTRFALIAAMLTLWWLFLFGGANLITTWHSYRVRLHFDAELGIPFVPAAVLVYLSIELLFAITPFVVRTPDGLRRLAATFAGLILVASVCFVLCPGDPHFQTPVDSGGWQPMIDFAKRLAMRHNFAPSLHVALSTACLLVFARQAPMPGKLALACWGAAIGLSTMLLHQHYLADVVSGYLLGWAGVYWIHDRLPAEEEAAGPGTPASPSRHRGPPA